MPTPNPGQHKPLRVAVIGAGVIGLSCALEMRRRGAEVAVYDRGAELGGGASIRAAGMLGAVYEGALESEAPALFNLMQEAAGLWPAFAKDVEKMGGGSIEYSAAGTLAGAEAGDVARLEALARACQARGVEARWLQGAALKAVEPALSDHVEAALLLPSDRQVDASMLLMRLGEACKRHGVGLRMARAVERIGVDNGYFVAPDGDRFDRVLLATGAGMPVKFARRDGELVAAGLPEIVPVKGHMLALAPPDRAPRHVIRMRDVYIAPKARWVLAGSTSERGREDTTVDRETIGALRAKAARAVDGLGEAAELAAWAGVRPGTADGLPLIGETAIPGVFAAMGMYRNGVLLAPAVARLAGGMVLDGNVSGAGGGFSPRRFDNRFAAPHSP
jgi:glycine oxidase